MCTNFLVKAGTNGWVNGRSMEFGADLKSNLFFCKTGHVFRRESSKSPGDFGYTWAGKYGFVGMNSLGLPFTSDGMNEKGLSAGALWLPKTKYPEITDRAKGLPVHQCVNWLLSSFASCKEVEAALSPGHEVVQVGFPKSVAKHAPAHFPVHDALGNSIVIEFLDGKTIISNNPVGVVTNYPPFQWHLQNLSNYVGISPMDAPYVKLGDYPVCQPGHGSGFAAIPGNAMPPSRFVRAVMMTQYADLVENLEDATSLAFHILNTVDIPKGTVRYKPRGSSDYTQWAVVKNLTERIYSVRFYDSPQVYSIKIDNAYLEKMDGKQLKVLRNPRSIDLARETGEVGDTLKLTEVSGTLKLTNLGSEIKQDLMKIRDYLGDTPCSIGQASLG